MKYAPHTFAPHLLCPLVAVAAGFVSGVQLELSGQCSHRWGWTFG